MSRLFALLAAWLLLLTFAPVAEAGTQGGCGIKLAGSLQVWENSIGDHSDGDDNLWVFCSPGSIPNGGIVVTNFTLVPHNLSGGCKSAYPHGDDWNDCISSATLWLPSSLWVVCFYQDANWGGQAAHFSGPRMAQRVNIPDSGGIINDLVSSIRLDNDGSC